MPILFSSVRICEKCGKEFEWNNFELKRQRIGAQLITPEQLPNRKTLVHGCEQKENNVYNIEVNCPHCGYDNHFSYIFEQK